MEPPSNAAGKHRTNIRVRYAETDQMGVVYHANYLVWMEIGRVELVRSRGFNYKDLEQTEKIFLTVVEANCRYHYPARYDQDVTVETEITEASPRLVQFSYNLLCSNSGRVLATGSTRHVWLNREWRPTKLPEKYRALLSLG